MKKKAIHIGAAIREFFEIFIQNTQNSTVLGKSEYIDEMLVGFWGRYLFLINFLNTV